MGNRKQMDQASKRRGNIWRDQHGREWGGTMSKETGTPIGELTPINGHKDGANFGWFPRMIQGKALLPSIHYMKFDDDRLGYFTIDYDRWVSDIEVAHNRWYDQAMSFAQALHGELAGKALENPTRELRSLTGPKPIALEVIEGLRDGDLWLLGMSDEQPDWMEKYINPQPFVPGNTKKKAVTV